MRSCEDSTTYTQVPSAKTASSTANKLVRTSRGRSHVLFGPDGNRRYARRMSIPYDIAYKALRRKLLDLVTWAIKVDGIDPLTIWLLQDYNLFRDSSEVPLLTALASGLTADLADLHARRETEFNGLIVGEMETFYSIAPQYKPVIEEARERLSGAQGMRVNLILAYNADLELRRALEACTRDNVELTFSALSERWSIPPVDLFIRTGQPDGFVNLSSYWPLIERGRIISTPTLPQDLAEQEFVSMFTRFKCLKDSVSKLETELEK